MSSYSNVSPASTCSNNCLKHLSSTFDHLLSVYNNSVSVLEGKGRKAQPCVDCAHQALAKFAKEHPELKRKVPAKITLCDDGCGGMQFAVYDELRSRCLLK